jgi:hypothetical protein
LTFLALVACSHGKDDGDPAETNGGSSQSVALTCEPQPDNALRFECEALLAKPGGATLTASAPGEIDRVFRDPVAATAHRFTVWGLPPEATWQATAAADDATASDAVDLATGPLPARFQFETTVETAGSAGFDAALLNYGCDGSDDLLAVDPAGRVVWYQDSTLTFPATSAPRTTRGWGLTDRGVVVTYDRDVLVEWDWAGHAVWSRTDLPWPLHHDAQYRDGKSYALFAENLDYPNGRSYVMDGYAAFDETGAELGEVHLADLFDPTFTTQNSGSYWDDLYPGSLDFAHVNALSIDEEGTAYLSLHKWDELVALDPSGALKWQLGGSPKSAALGSDVALTSSVTDDLAFEAEHSVTALGPDHLIVMDNGANAALGSRILELSIDEDAAQADIATTWDVGRFCDGQGSGFLLPNGHVLVDCAAFDQLLELDGSTPVWSISLACAGAPMKRPLYRANPINLPR